MRLFGKPSARQKEIRRSKAERRKLWYYRLVETLQLRTLLFLIIVGLLAAVIVNVGDDPLDLRLGQRVPRAIPARVDFRVPDQARTDFMRQAARDNVEDYYVLDMALVQDLRGRLASALRIAREQAAAPNKLRAQAREIKVVFDDAGLAKIIELATAEDSNTYQQSVERAVQALERQPLVEPHDLANRRTGINAVLVDPDQATERPVPSNELLFSNNPEHVERVASAVANRFPDALQATVSASLAAMLRRENDTFKPLYRYDTVRSALAAQNAENSVPMQYNEFPANTVLADAGPISEEELKRLEDEHAAYIRELHRSHAGWLPLTLAGLGRGVIAFLLVFGLGGYILVMHAHAMGGTQHRTATALTLLLVLLLARTAYINSSIAHLSVGIQAFAVALLTLIAAGGPAYAAGGLLAVMVGMATRQDLAFVIVLIAVSLVLYLGLHDVRNRGRIIAVGGIAALAAVVTTLLASMVDGQNLAFAFWRQGLWAGLTTLAAAFIIEGVLPGIERLFGVTTNMTLLEWCDPNKPVLRMLAAESPGTYNHSLLVGTLAQAAAESIGANGLLARAGAYYHDIGKINKPEYFVENQAMGVGNRHERLSPAMSHLIIIGHVKDGVEMAKEYGLPKRLHAFIPEHHGTSVVEYFYHAANQARKPGDPEVSDTQFRYPGPKPQSRETAILMLCDAVEGAVRAMPEPTPNRIEDTVDRLIEKRLIDGQFDECDLTFRELHTIRNSLVKSLSSIYHGRITYPSTSGKEPEARSAS